VSGPRDQAKRMPRSVAALLASALLLAPVAAGAYTAAGDRQFPATLILPQIAPTDEFYANFATQPDAAATPGAARRDTDLSLVYNKTITDRLGVQFDSDFTWRDRLAAPSTSGWQNLATTVKYLAVLDPAHEMLVSLGLGREWGDTGSVRVGASSIGATTGTVYLGKGLGDLDLGMLRPLAFATTVGYQVADRDPRPDLVQTGFVLEYSVPYLESKVRAFNLPDPVRAMTPMVETFVTTPAGAGRGVTSAVLGPGISYAGAGWEFGIEAMLPLTRAAGRGVGVTAQLHIALDYVFPESIGRPLLSPQ
jgi:hypothetical protein